MGETAIHYTWHKPPARAGLTIERRVRPGIRGTRRVRPHGLLDIEEAAAVLERSVNAVRTAIRAGFLRARRHGRTWQVTPAACLDFLADERRDLALLQRRDAQGRRPPVPWAMARKLL